MAAVTDPLIRGLARDESLTRGLGDEEARMLVEWTVDWAELLTGAARNLDDATVLVSRLARRARAIGRFVWLWDSVQGRRAALQLAATERFHWPLPTRAMNPGDLMQQILAWENQHHPTASAERKAAEEPV